MTDDPTQHSSTDPGRLLPIIGVDTGDLPDRVLVVGDPTRAERAASLIGDASEIGRNREYVTFRGVHRDIPVAITSHGVGAAGAGACFEELCRGGARRIIRAGTAGGMQDHLVDGALVIASGAVRDEGLTERIVPLSYPAIADHDIVGSLRAASTDHGIDTTEGIVLTSDIFYPHDVIGSNLELWQRAGVVAVEMECAALFVVAGQHGVAAGAMLALDGNPLAQGNTDMADYDPHRDTVVAAVDTALRIALDALVDDA